ncbi:MAG: twin transmembrane helix small protein [Legionellaceae bacterium]|nr:twin transmembrane helix small protein [Legionellaceae bacterium]
MFTKIFILIIMLIILITLFSGLLFLVRDNGKTKNTVKALTWRIALSLGLFIFLIIAFSLHWINPHGV